ncbi:S8 family serine peptidase, partial [Catellatospora chokoriensis]
MSADGPELVVVARGDAALRVTPSGLTSLAGYDTGRLNEICDRYGGTMRPLFGASEERILRAAAQAPLHLDVPDLSVYYHVDAPADQLQDIAAMLLTQPLVAGAYVKPRPELPTRTRSLPPQGVEPAAATPDFSGLQGHRGPAPGGVDVARAWALHGGRGAGVRIIDIEQAWRFTHEDLIGNQGGVLDGTPSAALDARNHGTAVIGVIGGDDNGFGVTGICPDANVSAISWRDKGIASAIHAAACRLGPGDIILVEVHAPGPRFNFTGRDDQLGYIAMEFWPDEFDAIRFATRVRGVIVVEAAGNGAENLDDQLYDARPAPFPDHWRNPFRRGDRDSDAILVGAGAPPPGTHDSNHGPDRSRLPFSNFGFAVDAQGWGEEVTTCGYGQLQLGANEDLFYTHRFNGTSSASPIIVG